MTAMIIVAVKVTILRIKINDHSSPEKFIFTVP